MFEDIGHSSEARTKLKEYVVGTLKVIILHLTYNISCYELISINMCNKNMQIIHDMMIQFDPSAQKAAKLTASSKTSEGKRGGLNPFAILALLIAIAIGYYFSQLQGK